jgi:hypothetical protein
MYVTINCVRNPTKDVCVHAGVVYVCINCVRNPTKDVCVHAGVVYVCINCVRNPTKDMCVLRLKTSAKIPNFKIHICNPLHVHMYIKDVFYVYTCIPVIVCKCMYM